MKIGILQCDSVVQEFQQTFGNYPQMFTDLFQQTDSTIITQIYNVEEGEYPKALHECDAYITTGSKASVYEDLAWLVDFKTFIQTLYKAKIKLIGICFGHQLIAEALGGRTEKSPKGWGVGVSVNQIIATQTWMQPELKELHIIVSHQDQVTKLPIGAKLLANSDFCPNYMYQIDDNILCIQGHPEWSKEYSETLMRYRQLKIQADAFEAGLASLKLVTHEEIFTQWMLSFFCENK